ncbi:hypothetical protein PQO03_02820 [Lentisphaera profundi]|uniref:Glycoside hydrolase family 42 N-terminal domain-containing protein n=1 Tax=Lentisphaera profundi TaxID=1658616 RepID=A0ABY7VRR5_9BACT|nr:hypothetical protein [Lentisphaera profundi]WDE96891.1 hypothetical protein PQO03_02820 [Lentisphaera profundi]
MTRMKQFFIAVLILNSCLVAWGESLLHPRNDHAPKLISNEMIQIFRQKNLNPKSLVQYEAGKWKIQARNQQPYQLFIRGDKHGWDLSSKLWLSFDIENKSAVELMVTGTVFESWNKVHGGVVVPAHSKETLYIHLPRKTEMFDDKDYLYSNIKGLPNGTYNNTWLKIDLSKIQNLDLDIFSKSGSLNFELSNLRGMADFVPLNNFKKAPKTRPYVDIYGQNNRDDWPGKIKNDQALHNSLLNEKRAMGARKKADYLSQFGGFLNAGKHVATGHFYTKKINGRWWFIDPEGYLFWSFGVTTITSKMYTKEPAFESLQSQTQSADELMYNKKSGWNPLGSNILKKYGANWRSAYAEMVHERIQSWGMNTLANWTQKEISGLQKTAYVVAVHFQRKEIKEGEHLKSLPDAYDPHFEKHIRSSLARYKKEAEDAWCLGFFVDNELDFGHHEYSIGKTIFEGNPNSFSRKVFVSKLQDKYSNIDELNKAWKTEFVSWDKLLGKLEMKTQACRQDMEMMSAAYLEKYYSSCSSSMKALAPNKLYLGSRIYQKENTLSLLAAARHCDVLSINNYDFSPLRVDWPKAIDTPVIIGEYHFGTRTESGVWGGGLCTSVDLSHAAEQFRYYSEQAMQDPRFVGAHYFQWSDQVVTGRKDGENYRIGFVSITDEPYAEMVEASRRAGKNMYSNRLAK